MKATRVGWIILVLVFAWAVFPHHLSFSQSQQQETTPGKDKALEAARLTLAQAEKLARSETTREQAIAKFHEARQLFRAAGDTFGEARTLQLLGFTYDTFGDKRQAIDCLEQALSLTRSLADRSWEATTLRAIGLLYFSIGEKRTASKFFTEALAIVETVEGRPGEGALLLAIGRTLSDLGEKQKALDLVNRALLLFGKENDRKNEAMALNILGSIHADLGEPKKALEFYNLALILRRAEGDRAGEGTTLNNIARVYEFLGDKQRALELHNQALTIRREVGDPAGEAASLNNIAVVYQSLGQRQKAIEYFNISLPLRRAVGDRGGEAATLNNLGAVYNSLGETQKAIALYQASLELSRALEDRSAQASTLNNLGAVYSVLGDKQKALEYSSETLSIRRSLNDREGEALALNNMGSMYKALGKFKEALDAYVEASRIQNEIGDRHGRATTLANVGDLYGSAGENHRALEFLELSLKIFRELGARGHEATVLGNIGLVYLRLDDRPKALEFYNRSLTLYRSVVDPQGEAITLTNLMFAWKDSHGALAVFYGKQAVNTLQQLRANISGLDQELQRTFLKSKEDIYRTLVDLLIEQGRLPEAQQVLSLLKEEEYFDFVRREGDEASALTGRTALTPEEALLERRYREISDRVASIGAEYTQLRDKRERNTNEEQRLVQLGQNLIVANQVFQRFLDEIDKTLSRAGRSDKAFQLRESQGLMETLRELGSGTLALYTVVAEDRYHVILVTPAVQKAYTHEIKAADLNRKVLEFREALQNPRVDSRLLGQELHRILIGPELARDLEQAKGQTLMWSLDGVLRYLPVAALHDGQKYLVERYCNVVFTPASQSRLKDPVSVKWKALGFGVSKAHKGFNSLPGVAEELHGIIRDESAKPKTTGGVLVGKVILDEAFTATSMQAALRQGYPLVHIASHFSFKPGNETDSFLLLGDGSYLTLAQIKSLPNVFSGVDLLTLSACDTATGGAANGKEVEGFGVLAQRQGAKAVMATLWPVVDNSTQLLMREFYRLRDTNPRWSKAEALRQAQLGLLSGATKLEKDAQDRRAELVASGSQSGGTGQPVFQPDAQAPYAHPYYWAPFIMIGNWR